MSSFSTILNTQEQLKQGIISCEIRPFSLVEKDFPENSKINNEELYTLEQLDLKYNLERFISEEEQFFLSLRKPDYFENQKHLSPTMRSILLDWLMEICATVSFKRCTYHASVSYLDLFLSLTSDIETNKLQLLGVVCLIISAKNEEISLPNLECFSRFTDLAYNKKQIIKYEQYVLEILNYRIIYPNLGFWANYTLLKWDEFTDFFLKKYTFDLPLYFKHGLKLPKFRENTDEEYFLFRNFFQIIDLITLDFEFMKFSDKLLSISIIYILVGLMLKIFTLSEVLKEYTNGSQFFSKFIELNDIFNKFINSYFATGLDDLIDHLIYVCQFFNIQFDYSLPINQNESIDQMVII
jgi:hypothetical protein